MINTTIIRTILLGGCFLILAVFILKKEQSVKLNWSLFYSFIWMLFALPILNFKCINLGFWEFLLIKDSILKIPYDILFIWCLCWLVPFYFFKGKYILLIGLFLFWIDILTMPLLEKVGLLELKKNWLIGEFLMMFFVFMPGYLWGKFYYENKKIWLRALLQVIVMTMFLTLVIPFLIKNYEGIPMDFGKFSGFWVQIIFIIAFPSLIAVIDLVQKGKGTPFPYDKTQHLVQTGVYAYIKNPIQWSFTMLFIPLAIYHQSVVLLFGMLISILYTVGVSNAQENEDMYVRFKQEWKAYKNRIPSWYFLWKPKEISIGVIYFKRNCNQCEEIKKWFENKSSVNLEIRFSDAYEENELLQVTYLHFNGNRYNSVEAIAHALEHVNLAYASLGWFMRFPGIRFLLKAIIDAIWSLEEKNVKLKIK